MHKKFWIAKETGPRRYYDYYVFKKEPTEENINGMFHGNNFITYLCAKEFEKTTDIKLKPGQFCEVELKVTSPIYEYKE